jgi:hypothetical protein
VDFNFGNARERVTQQVLMFNRTAPTGHSAPLSEDIDQHQLVSSFLINNYTNSGSSVFLGVTPGLQSSIEIPPGASPVFTVFQEGRQAYELQILISQIASQQAQDLIKIPVVTFDLTHFYIQAGGNEDVLIAVMAFPLPYL